jgi:hypothetical protein
MKLDEHTHQTIRLLVAMFWGSIIMLSIIDVAYKYAMHESTLKHESSE